MQQQWRRQHAVHPLGPLNEPDVERLALLHLAAGNPGPSISGAPPLKTLLAEITRTVRPLSTVTKPLTQPDGSQSYGGLRIGGSGDQYEIDVYVNPADTSLIQVTCTSPAGAADAVRAVCTDLPYSGADPTTARAWVAGAAKKIPAGNTTARIRDNDLNGLFWLVRLDSTGKNEIVTVSSRLVSS